MTSKDLYTVDKCSTTEPFQFFFFNWRQSLTKFPSLPHSPLTEPSVAQEVPGQCGQSCSPEPTQFVISLSHCLEQLGFEVCHHTQEENESPEGDKRAASSQCHMIQPDRRMPATSSPRLGDLIEIDRTGYAHWAIYVGNDYVVHLAPPNQQPGHYPMDKHYPGHQEIFVSS
ncbi:PREDICTED: uncharacterized protein LOC102003559 isoform X2 [Chinchilla lanigera]|uniref:uncharacterized protein LOC102003559 isoform X2 n=1 Tax=Chinchilla lanigera TaxID=34839 RepID=UPI000697C3A5|nr:PREDICTED: uncharacterized protein LOC102003559 isoform X2 [Chinchilla lanigera]